MLQRWYHSLQGIIPQHALGIIFEELGFFYYGPIDGHDIDALRHAFRATHWMRRPVLIHAVTRKGRGYKDDVPEATCYHAASGSNGRRRAPAPPSIPEQGGPSFTAAFADQATRWPSAIRASSCITAAMLEGTGLVKFQAALPRALPRRRHGGAARRRRWPPAWRSPGYRPICAIYSTFLQRAYDQLFQEVALQKRAGAVLPRSRRRSSAPTARRTTASSTSPTCAACRTSC